MDGLEMEIIILLGVWIYFLQRNIDRLEKRVKKLESKEFAKEVENSSIEERIENSIDSEERISPPQPNSVESVTLEQSSLKTEESITENKKSKKSATIFELIKRYLFGGNILVRLGGVVLFFGLAFLAKYMAEHSHITIQMRIGAILAIGVTLIGIGWRLRKREGAYGQILQGVGIATLYLTIFATAKLYHLITPSTAFTVMLLIVTIASLLALAQDSLPMMLFASSGGFLVPILTSEGDGSHILLFGYYAVLDIGIFIIAWRRSWRVLNIVGFLFTFVIATVWGVLHYHHTLFWSVEPFLILYFAIYLTISILYTLKRRFKPKNLIDSTLVFGLPLVAFPLQLSLVRGFDNGEAISSIALGTLYLILSFILRNNKQADILVVSFKAIALIFYTISIGYIFDRDMKVTLWALEASALLWSSIRQNRRFGRYFAEILLIISMAILNRSEYWESIIVVASALFSIYWLDYAKKSLLPIERLLSHLLTLWILVIWFESTSSKFTDIGIDLSFSPLFALIALGVIFFLIDRFFKWHRIATLLEGYWIVGIVLYIYAIEQSPISQINPFGGSGLIGWIGLNILGYYLLYRYDRVWFFTLPIHILSLWFNTAVLSMELHYIGIHSLHSPKFADILTGVTPIILSLTLLLWKNYPKWLERYKDTYRFTGVGGLNLAILVYALYIFRFSPESSGYIPIFNIIDIMQILSTVSIYLWISINSERFVKEAVTLIYVPFSILSLVTISVIYARAIHIYSDTPYTLYEIWQNLYFQTGLSLLWSIAGIVLMLLSKYYLKRSWWIAGFGILLLVVVKLFLIELSGRGTIERIVSFIAVGTLLLLIGYFVPMPPSEDRKGKI